MRPPHPHGRGPSEAVTRPVPPNRPAPPNHPVPPDRPAPQNHPVPPDRPAPQNHPQASAPSRALRTLVGVARVLAGGLVVLAVIVLVAPLALGGTGAGVDTVVGHLVAAAVAVGATALAAHRRTPAPVATGAALLVPVTLVLLLGIVWWS